MKKKRSFRNILQQSVMILVLIALVIVFSIICPILMDGRQFLTMANLMNILGTYAWQVITGVGITFIMLGGAMDLSTGYILSTIGIVMALVDGGDSTGDSTFFLITLIVGIALGAVLSGFNGVMYAWLRVFPFVITLGTQYILNGVTYLLSGGISHTYKGLSVGFEIMGGYNIPFIGNSYLKSGVIVMIICVLIGSFILNKTHFGRNVYALGSNPDAVALSGVSVAKMRIAVFAIAGIFFAIAQTVQIGYMSSANQSLGVGAEFTVMAGAMLGGVKMGGGGGKMSNMVTGVLIIAVLNQGMTFLNINQYWQYVALGIVLLAAISVDTMQTRAAVNAAKKVAGKPPAEEKKQVEAAQ